MDPYEAYRRLRGLGKRYVGVREAARALGTNVYRAGMILRRLERLGLAKRWSRRVYVLLGPDGSGKTRYTVVKENGMFPPRHHGGVDPGLVGLRAFGHPSVREWWRWLLEDYQPHHPVALITPCSNVKPYTRSPTSRKIRGLLRKLGLWSNGLVGLEWLYFSDLLVLVPYERAEGYPACCYDVAPDLVLGSSWARRLVAETLAQVMEALTGRGLRELIVYLPRKHLIFWEEAKSKAKHWPSEVIVRYSIFGPGDLARVLEPRRRIAGLQELL